MDIKHERGNIQSQIDYLNFQEGGGREVAQLSDGHHTFDELYEFRKLYNALLFNEWSREYNKGISKFAKPLFDVHKSWKHHDGELCFGGGWFVVVAILPAGQITNHYRAKDWDLFKIPEVEKAKYEFDNHTGKDTLDRMKHLLSK